ncbi:helix-turn-helix transcriptional regulator [Pedobacter frigidisoli]|uniref:helix-turn-helix domain-containing protein n=1 Tax=Pedobacter frigidisoli TaxID=2530455 RepID=UPI00292FF1A7|nr:helix-turn-helix transcriptional regulator [Pedobacter frigidisoli]
MKGRDEHYFEIIGKNVRRIRIENKLSQHSLAVLCDKIDRSKISDIENAKEDFMLSTILEICAALKINLTDLLIKIDQESDILKNK